MPRFGEKPVVFECGEDTLIGVLHRPDHPRSRLGILIVVGGPQYRVGSHRQFLLLARKLAESGFAVFRFDLRGMGDSEGEQITFEESAPDIAAACDAFFAEQPDLHGLIMWGLCDAASSILMFGVNDSRVRGAALLNPWVRSDATLASARIATYYGNRLLSAVFWKRLLTGGVDIKAALGGFLDDWRKKFSMAKEPAQRKRKAIRSEIASSDFRELMRDGLHSCELPILLVLSGEDLTAAEFVGLTESDSRWQDALKRKNVTIRRLEGADHTFSSAAWRGQVEQWTLAWLNGFSTHDGAGEAPGRLADESA